MSVVEVGRIAVAALASMALAVSSASDIRDRRIPNWTVLVVIALSAVWIALGASPLISSLAAFAIAATATVILWSLKVVGAGDSKLFTALALFSGLAGLPQLAVLTVIAGGAVAIASLASRPSRALAMLQPRGQGEFGRGVPYGVAIAAGGLVVIWSVILAA